MIILPNCSSPVSRTGQLFDVVAAWRGESYQSSYQSRASDCGFLHPSCGFPRALSLQGDIGVNACMHACLALSGGRAGIRTRETAHAA